MNRISYVLLTIMAFGALILTLSTINMKESLSSVLHYIIEHPIQGPVIYLLVFTLSAVCCIPVTYLSLASGFVFRPMIWSIILILLGCQFSLLSALIVGSYVFPQRLESPTDGEVDNSWFKPVRGQEWKKIISLIEKNGLKMVVLMRLSPLFPFGIVNYALSFTTVPLRTIMLGTLVGNLPGAILNTFLGSLAENLLDIKSVSGPWKWLILCLGAFSTIAIIIMIAQIAKQNLNEALQDVEDEEKQKETDAFMIEH